MSLLARNALVLGSDSSGGLVLPKAMSQKRMQFEKENSYVKCNEGKHQKNSALRESHRMD